jgi:hypothetical protein
LAYHTGVLIDVNIANCIRICICSILQACEKWKDGQLDTALVVVEHHAAPQNLQLALEAEVEKALAELALARRAALANIFVD